MSAYDFICLFVAGLTKKHEYSFDSDKLADFIAICRGFGKHQELLEDIDVKSNGVFFFSSKLTEVITTLKFTGALFTISSERDGTIYVNKFLNEFSCESELLTSRRQHLDKAIEFVKDYQKYLRDPNEYAAYLAYEKLAGQEQKDIDKAVKTLDKIMKTKKGS